MRLLLTNEQLETLNELEVEDELVFMPESSESLDSFLYTDNEVDEYWVDKLLFAKEHPEVIEVIEEGEQRYDQLDVPFNSLFNVKLGGKYVTRGGHRFSTLESLSSRSSRFSLEEIIGQGLNDEVELIPVEVTKEYTLSQPLAIEFQTLDSLFNSPYEAISQIFKTGKGEWYYYLMEDYEDTNRIFCELWNREALLTVHWDDTFEDDFSADSGWEDY